MRMGGLRLRIIELYNYTAELSTTTEQQATMEVQVRSFNVSSFVNRNLLTKFLHDPGIVACARIWRAEEHIVVSRAPGTRRAVEFFERSRIAVVASEIFAFDHGLHEGRP